MSVSLGGGGERNGPFPAPPFSGGTPPSSKGNPAYPHPLRREIQQVAPWRHGRWFFPKVHPLKVDDADDEDFLVNAPDLTVAQALKILDLEAMPASPRHLYMATYGRFKEAETANDENFPSKGELRDARELIKAVMNNDS